MRVGRSSDGQRCFRFREGDSPPPLQGPTNDGIVGGPSRSPSSSDCCVSWKDLSDLNERMALDLYNSFRNDPTRTDLRQQLNEYVMSRGARDCSIVITVCESSIPSVPSNEFVVISYRQLHVWLNSTVEADSLPRWVSLITRRSRSRRFLGGMSNRWRSSSVSKKIQHCLLRKKQVIEVKEKTQRQFRCLFGLQASLRSLHISSTDRLFL